jgi:hypothetical protein
MRTLLVDRGHKRSRQGCQLVSREDSSVAVDAVQYHGIKIKLKIVLAKAEKLIKSKVCPRGLPLVEDTHVRGFK